MKTDRRHFDTRLPVRVCVICLAGLLAAWLLPTANAAGDWQGVTDTAVPLADYATDSINSILGAYALLPIDPMFNLGILTVLALLSHGGVVINSAIQATIDANALFGSSVLCWILFGLCVAIGITQLVLKYIPGLSAAAESAMQKVVDGLVIAVRMMPYAILFIPTAAAASQNIAEVAGMTAGKVFIALAVAAAGLMQYIVLKLARSFFDLLVSISPEPVTTTVVEVGKKLLSAVLWLLALYAPEVLVIINLIGFFIAAFIARKGWLLTVYCRGMYLRTLKHTLRRKRGKLNEALYGPRPYRVPRYVEKRCPGASCVLAAYAGGRMGRFGKRVPRWLQGWLVEYEDRLYFCGKVFLFFPRMIPLEGPCTLTTGWTGARLRFQAPTGHTLKVDLSPLYKEQLLHLADTFGWRNLTEEKRRTRAEKKARRKEERVLRKQRRKERRTGVKAPSIPEELP